MTLLSFVRNKVLTISMIHAKMTGYLKALVELPNGCNLLGVGECLLQMACIQAEAILQLRFTVLGQPVALVPIVESQGAMLSNHDFVRHGYGGGLRFEANAYRLD